MDWTLVAIIAGVILADLSVRLAFVPVALRIFETKPPLRAELAPPDSQAQEVTFPTSDGLALRGNLYLQEERPSRGMVVFCPELSGNRWSAMSYCQGLWEAGFDLFSFDFRNQGESDRMPGYDPLHWVTEYEVDDVLAAIRYVRQHPYLQALPIGVYGISRGGGAGLIAASRCRHVERVACDGAFSTDAMIRHHTRRWIRLYVPAWVLKLMPWWHVRMTLRLVRWVSQTRRGCRYASFGRCLPELAGTPVLLIVGERDNYVDPEIVGEMARRIGSSCRSVWVVPDAKHNMARQMAPQAYDRRLVQFFSQLRSDIGPRPEGERQEVKQTQH